MNISINVTNSYGSYGFCAPIGSGSHASNVNELACDWTLWKIQSCLEITAINIISLGYCF